LPNARSARPYVEIASGSTQAAQPPGPELCAVLAGIDPTLVPTATLSMCRPAERVRRRRDGSGLAVEAACFAATVPTEAVCANSSTVFRTHPAESRQLVASYGWVAKSSRGIERPERAH
jgi:hypothetical protein